MKNILFKILPLLAAVLFATSCSKDDDNGNTVVPDNTNISVIPASNDVSTTGNPSTPSKTVQVQYDENGMPYIPFSITVGRDDSESLSKYFVTDYYNGKMTQYFDKDDKLTIEGKYKKIKGKLTVDEKDASSWGSSNMSTSAKFTGMLWGEDIESLEEGDWLIATLNDGQTLSEPKVYDQGDNKLFNAINKGSYLTAEFQYISNENYSTYYGNDVRLRQRNAFLVFNMEYSAKVIIKYNGKDYPFFLKGSTNYNPGQTKETLIAVPDGSYVRSCFLKDEHHIDSENDNGKVIHNIKRLQPSDVITRGTFSISEDKQVFFSTGNLVYGISNDVIGFEKPWGVSFESGYDVGHDHENMNGRGYVDLFGWGTWLKGAATDALLMTTTFSGSYQWIGGEHTVADYFYDEIWYTLTKDEWDYLLNKREVNNPQNLRYVRASIKLEDGTMVPGLILFPDCFDRDRSDMGPLFGGELNFKGADANFDENFVEENYWTNFELFSYGAVFLPCAGRRNGSYGTTISDCYNKGYYWTSSSKYTYDAHGLHISNDGVTFETTDKCEGLSVRLVRDVITSN